MAKRILITGASGFLGKHLVRHFSEKDDWDVLPVTGRAQLRDLPEKPLGAIDIILHAGFSVDFSPFAPSTPHRSENFASTQKIIRLAEASAVKQVVFLGAAGALGVSRDPRARNEEEISTTDAGFEAYLHTNYIQEKIIAEKALQKGLRCPLVTLYLTTVYGPGMNTETRAALNAASSLNPFLFVPPGGTSFLGLNDFLRGVDRAVESRATDSFVLSSGNETFASLLRQAARFAGTEKRKCLLTLPGESRNAICALKKWAPRRFLSTAVLESTFGYKYYSPAKAMHTMGWEPRQKLSEIFATLGS